MAAARAIRSSSTGRAGCAPARGMGAFGRYSREEERWFAQKLERMLYKPKLASGGPDERRLLIRMSRVAGRMTSDEAGRYPKEARALLRAMAGKYRETSGRYYVFKPLPDPIKAAWEKCKKEAIADEDVEARCISEAVLQGFPESITDFVVEPLFVLVGINGTRYRVVRIRNVHGEVTGSLRWPAEEFASPKAMRIWLNNNANCANLGGGRARVELPGDGHWAGVGGEGGAGGGAARGALRFRPILF